MWGLQWPRRESEQLIPLATEAAAAKTINPALSHRKAHLCEKRDVRGINRAIREGWSEEKKGVVPLPVDRNNFSHLSTVGRCGRSTCNSRFFPSSVCARMCSCVLGGSRFSLFLRFNKIGRQPTGWHVTALRNAPIIGRTWLMIAVTNAKVNSLVDIRNAWMCGDMLRRDGSLWGFLIIFLAMCYSYTNVRHINCQTNSLVFDSVGFIYSISLIQ